MAWLLEAYPEPLAPPAGAGVGEGTVETQGQESGLSPNDKGIYSVCSLFIDNFKYL